MWLRRGEIIPSKVYRQNNIRVCIIWVCSCLSGQSAWIWSPSLPRLTLLPQPITEGAQSQKVRVSVSTRMRGRYLGDTSSDNQSVAVYFSSKLLFFLFLRFCFILFVHTWVPRDKVTTREEVQTFSLFLFCSPLALLLVSTTTYSCSSAISAPLSLTGWSLGFWCVFRAYLLSSAAQR